VRRAVAGNVRQLENTDRALAALAHDSTLTAADFVLEQRGHEAPVSAPLAVVAASEEELPDEDGPSLREQVEAFERGVIARALAATGGNQSEAARRLGTSRVTLIDKIKKYGLGGR
jgi:DNA-binding NtrC family response regulator